MTTKDPQGEPAKTTRPSLLHAVPSGLPLSFVMADWAFQMMKQWIVSFKVQIQCETSCSSVWLSTGEKRINGRIGMKCQKLLATRCKVMCCEFDQKVGRFKSENTPIPRTLANCRKPSETLCSAHIPVPRTRTEQILIHDYSNRDLAASGTISLPKDHISLSILKAFQQRMTRHKG